MLNETRGKSSRNKPEFETTLVGRRQKRNKNARGNQRIASTREEERNDENDENQKLTESDRL